MLRFTTASEDPVICAVVVVTNQLTLLDACGSNPLSDNFLGPETLEEKMGEKKYNFGCDRLFPMGLTCEFQGK
jgi:hypothetical protein